MTDASTPPLVTSEMLGGDASTELSSNRTAMSFERTKLSMDRTLMSVMRTSISLIGFGFTIYQFFQKATKVPGVTLAEHAPRNFGLSMMVVGILLLAWGIGVHYIFERNLHARRMRLQSIGLIRHADKGRASMTTTVATILLFLAILALASLVFRVGPLD